MTKRVKYLKPFNWFSFPTPNALHYLNYTTVSFHCPHPVDFVGIQKKSSMVFWCSINCKCSSTMNRQDKPNLAISRTFRLRGWKLIWQHAFKRQPGATGHTWAYMCFHVSLVAVVFNYYVFGLFGQSFTLGLLFVAKWVHIKFIINCVFFLWIFSTDNSL